MQAGRELFIVGDTMNPLSVFCYHGEPKMITTLFKTIEVSVCSLLPYFDSFFSLSLLLCVVLSHLDLAFPFFAPTSSLLLLLPLIFASPSLLSPSLHSISLCCPFSLTSCLYF